jgi:hypothetical protein
MIIQMNQLYSATASDPIFLFVSFFVEPCIVLYLANILIIFLFSQGQNKNLERYKVVLVKNPFLSYM